MRPGTHIHNGGLRVPRVLDRVASGYSPSSGDIFLMPGAIRPTSGPTALRPGHSPYVPTASQTSLGAWPLSCLIF